LEQAIVFGQGLAGVLCEPEPRRPSRSAVLFCNTGGDPRAGIGGFATSAARALAVRGVASLRFDFQGLGDSPLTPPVQRSHVYETPRDGDLRAAVVRLAEEGYDRIDLVGICAGAYHALKYAPTEPQVTGVFAISPVKLVWRKGDSLIFGRRDDGPSTEIYLRALGDRATYLRLLTGDVDAPVVLRNLGKRLGNRLQGSFDRMAGRSPLKALAQFSRRGGRVHLLMGTDDVSLDEVATWFGPQAKRLTRLPGMSVSVEPRLDHGLAYRKSRDLALDALLTWRGLPTLDALTGVRPAPQ
jgi:pimeloyl-ACP methyl ester carboxylesterase